MGNSSLNLSEVLGLEISMCSAALKLRSILLINVKMPTIVGILTFISRINRLHLRVLRQQKCLFFKIAG